MGGGGRRGVERTSPEYVVAAGSDRGNEVLAHVAARLDLPFAANCHRGARRRRDARPLGRLAARGGAAARAAEAAHRLAAFASPPRRRARRRVESSTPALRDATRGARDRDASRRRPAAISLADAKVVVSGGRGVGSAEDFAIIEELAGLLGAAVGCSRVVTSAGWRPHSDQVGQTGTKVSPDLYVACGISGATQHIAGCKGAKKMLVINADPEAPIFAHADYAVIGDLHEIVPAISPSSGRREADSGRRRRGRTRRAARRRGRPVRAPRLCSSRSCALGKPSTAPTTCRPGPQRGRDRARPAQAVPAARARA